MQISIETTSGLERRLTISVPSETFEEQITDRLGQAAGQVRLPGFRPGKVPMREVRRRFGPAVRAEVAGELMQSSFVEAVQQEDLSPAGSPSLEVVKMDPGIDFEFTATFEVFPVVDVTDLSKVSVKRPEAEITDADLDEMIDRLREQRKDWRKVERGAQEGDKVTLDFVGKIDDEAFDGGSGEDMSFEVGAGQMIEDFDQGVRGLAEGDSGEFAATFPALVVDKHQQADSLARDARERLHVEYHVGAALGHRGRDLPDQLDEGIPPVALVEVDHRGIVAYRLDLVRNHHTPYRAVCPPSCGPSFFYQHCRKRSRQIMQNVKQLRAPQSGPAGPVEPFAA